MCTEAAISSTVTGCAKCARIQRDRFGHSLHSRLCVADLRDPVADGGPQQSNQDLVDDQRSEKLRILRLRHQVEQARHRVDDVIGRAPDIQAATVRRLGNAARVHPGGELCDARGIEIEHEAEIRILPTGASHLGRDRQIHGEDEQVRGIVFEHFAAEHHHLGALRRDAQRRTQRGIGWPQSSSATAGWPMSPAAGAEKPHRGGRTPRVDWRAVAGAVRLGVAREVSSLGAVAGLAKLSERAGRDCTRAVVRRRRVCSRACRAGVAIPAMVQRNAIVTFAQTSGSNTRSPSTRAGIGKNHLARPSTLIV